MNSNLCLNNIIKLLTYEDLVMGKALKTAIIIDDDIDTVEVLNDLLEIEGIKVLAKGYNGKEAFEAYQKFSPDLVFLDVMMPLYDGFYALEKIKELNPSSVVIMITADLTHETENRLKILNADATVFKPYDIKTVTETINRLSEK